MPYHYEFISKHDPRVKKAYSDLLEIITQVQDLVRDKITFSFQIVGSYKYDLMTYDPLTNIGYDFDFNLTLQSLREEYSPQEIRDIFITALKRVAPKYGYNHVENSTRVITIKVTDLFHSRIVRSCDFAIVNNYEEKGVKKQQYIRYVKDSNLFVWTSQPKGFYHKKEKLDWIKQNHLWEELKTVYLNKKNDNHDPHKHSRSLLAESINEICS